MFKLINTPFRTPMRAPYIARARDRHGKARYGILMWLLGVPIPLILLFFLIRGCVA